MKLPNIFKKLSKKMRAVVAVAGIAAVVAIPLAVMAEYYPVRPVFDYNKAPLNGSTCVAADSAALNRCGSLQGPVLNSFINTPSYGDERAFFDGRRADQTVGQNADLIGDVTTGSKEVVLRTYVHNNANQNTNNTIGVAKNAKVRVALPTATAQVLRARSYITADNAASVEDTADMSGSQQFSVSYVAGSAKLLRGTASYNLSDNIVTTGALIGDKTMDGNLPGCFDFAALVEIRVRVQTASYNLDLTKQVRKHVDGQTGNWSKEVSVPAGTKVDYVLNTKNAGAATLMGVTTRDVLPPHTQLVPGSIKYINAKGSGVQADAPLFGGGIIGGQYNPNDDSLIVFSAITKDDFAGCSTKVRNIAFAKSTTTPEINDYADVTITKENCNPVTPVYSCDLLSGAKIGDHKYKFDVRYIAKDGATLKNLKYVYGDGSSVNTTATTTEHTYAKDGTFNIAVAATFTVNDKDQTVTSETCATSITISPKPVIPVYSCDLFTADKIADKTYRYTTKFTARDGATLKYISYDFADGSDKLMTDKTVVEHTYAKDGTYVPRAVVVFMVNGEEKKVESDKCSAAVTISTPPVTPPTTPPSGKLTDTGSGNILGLFAAVTLIGAFMHRAYADRKSA
ncbi:MAG: hypothetical protein NTX11_04555 [Candidatus Saccharibacteria bacterium]|nr:hypothetical protein [Candidatus Saccharibacteria bacterium]